MYRLINFGIFICVIFSMFLQISSEYVNPAHTKPWKVRFYPRKTMFKKSDLINKGCTVFIRSCPTSYKIKSVCARHYDGHYRTFNNYCEMEFENCNSWRKWTSIKHGRC